MAHRPIAAGVPPAIPVGKSELEALIAKGKADPTATRTLRCRTVATGRFRQINYIRDLPPAQPMTDGEADNLLGDDVSASALEGLLAALGSCLAMGIHATAVARRILI